ncbi:uncharacterized protein LOC144641626 [Oculina patagonica]
MKSLFVLAFLLCISIGYGLKCYQCYTTTSWEECDSNKKEVTCASGLDRCGKAYVSGKSDVGSVAIYVKGCGDSSACDADTSDLCKSSDPSVKVDCDINCCSGDLCNGAKVPNMVSAFMLLACALAAFLR